MEVESTGAEALPEHAETQRPPRRPSPISLARQPSAQWDSKDEGASGARRDSKESPASAERRDSKESPASGTPQRRLSAAIKRKLTPAPQRSYDFFDIDDEYMRLEEEGNISERAPFPAQDDTRCPVFNPNANWRLGWDGYMLVLVTFVFFVTPFEIAFVNRGEYWDGLWTMNRLVDLSFFGDMVLTFNTGYYNWRDGGGDDVCERRDATIVGLLGDMRYDVRYDDGSVERGVAHARISVQDEEVAIQKAVSAMEIATKLLVTQIAHAMEMAMFMAGDYIVRHSVSFCDTMYLVDAGKVMTFGREVTAPFALSVVEDGDSFGDKEIATLVAGHGARAAWFNARATRMSYCYVLGGRVFVKLINRPGFENFLKYISRYGTWYNFKLNVVKAMRSGELAAVAKLARPPAEAAAEEIRRGEAARVEAAVGAVVGKLADAMVARFDDLQRSVDARFAALEAKLDAAAASWSSRFRAG